jgi:hypothetical protein
MTIVIENKYTRIIDWFIERGVISILAVTWISYKGEQHFEIRDRWLIFRDWFHRKRVSRFPIVIGTQDTLTLVAKCLPQKVSYKSLGIRKNIRFHWGQ